MVIEELVAKLGFKVDGLNEIKRFDNALVQSKARLRDFGRNLSTLLTDKLARLNTFLPKLANGFKGGVSQLAMFGAALGRITLVAGAVVGGVALVAGAVFKMALAFVRARGEAAKLRREMQLGANANRTTAANVEKVQRGFDAVTAGNAKGKANDMVGAIATKVQEAIEGKDYSKFKEAGINPLEKNGVRRDSSALLLELIAKYLEKQKAGQDAGAKERDAKARGDKKGEARAAKQRNVAEVDASKFAKEWGIDGPLLGGLMQLSGGMKEFLQRMEEANRANPTPSKEDEKLKADVANEWQKLKNALEGLSGAITGPLETFKDLVANKLIPPMTSLVNAIHQWLKKIGWAPETKGETDDREKAQAQEPKGVGPAKAAGAKVSEADQRGFWETIFASAFDKSDAGQKARAELKDRYDAYQLAKARRDNNVGGNPEYLAKLQAALEAAAAAMREAAEKAKPYIDNEAAEKIGKAVPKREVKVENSGNDQRSFTIKLEQTVTGGEAAAQAAGATKSAVASIASTQKDMNIWTSEKSQGA